MVIGNCSPSGAHITAGADRKVSGDYTIAQRSLVSVLTRVQIAALALILPLPTLSQRSRTPRAIVPWAYDTGAMISELNHGGTEPTELCFAHRKRATHLRIYC